METTLDILFTALDAAAESGAISLPQYVEANDYLNALRG